MLFDFFSFSNKFGEKNLQTAKHLGNLGRLYQSMKKYQVCVSFFYTLLTFSIILLSFQNMEYTSNCKNYETNFYSLSEKTFRTCHISVSCVC